MSGLPDLSGSGDCLLAREGGRIVAAPQQDQAVVRTYPEFNNKGPVIDGYRLTLLTSRAAYGLGEAVRVYHICESVARERPLYPHGPKVVLGEYVDDQLTTDAPLEVENPVAPASYDGRVRDGPGVDTNYEVTEYRFEEPGTHRIQWRLRHQVSNVVTIEILSTAS